MTGVPVTNRRELPDSLPRTHDVLFGRPRGAAAKLGIPPSTLESKIKQLKIEKSRFSASDTP